MFGLHLTLQPQSPLDSPTQAWVPGHAPWGIRPSLANLTLCFKHSKKAWPSSCLPTQTFKKAQVLQLLTPTPSAESGPGNLLH